MWREVALCAVSRKTYFTSKIAECGCSQKGLSGISKNLMGHKGKIILPSYSSGNDLANKFSDFFTKKTATIRDTIINNGSSMSDTIVMSADVKFEGQHLTHFKPATQDEVRIVVMKSPSKSCELDPLPTNLLKKVLECLLPLITRIINKSLVECYVRAYFKSHMLDH